MIENLERIERIERIETIEEWDGDKIKLTKMYNETNQLVSTNYEKLKEGSTIYDNNSAT